MKKLLLGLALALAAAAPAYAAGETAAHPRVTRSVVYAELHHDLGVPYAFAQDGHRISVLGDPTPHQNERWIRVDGGPPRLVIDVPDTSGVVAEAGVGSGSYVSLATAYAACADLGAGLCLTTAGQISLADPVAALVVTTLTPTTIAGNYNSTGTPTYAAGLNVTGGTTTLSGATPAIAASANTGAALALTSGVTSNDVSGYTLSCAGCTASAANKAAGVLAINQPAGSNTNLMAFLDGGTSCTGSIQCYANMNAVAAGTLTLSVETAASTDGLIVSQSNTSPGTCTGANKIFAAAKDNNTEFQVRCNGKVLYSGLLNSNSSCGTKTSPMATNAAACGGDTGFVQATSNSAQVNFPSSSANGGYVGVNNYFCSWFDITTNTLAGVTAWTFAATSVTFTTSGATDIVWFNCRGTGG